MITDNFKITLVTYAYAVVVRDFTKNEYRPIVKSIDDWKSKAGQNCLRFYEMTEEIHESIYDTMLCGLILYPADWCMKIFKRPYLPFSVLIAEKCRNKILKEFPKYRKTEYPGTVPDRVRVLLGGFPKSVRRELIESGILVGDDRLAKNALLEKLK